MSTKPYEPKEWVDLFISIPCEKHLDLLIALGIFKASDNGEAYISSLALSGDTGIIIKLMQHPKSFAEAFEGIDIERLAYTHFSDNQYETMMINEWKKDVWAKTGLEHHKLLNKWVDLFKLFPISDEIKKGLPDGNFTIYRAGSSKGIAWTMNKGIASWFYARNKILKSESKHNRFLSLNVTKDDVIFYHNKSGEEVVVLIPNENKIKIIPYNEHKDFEEVIPKNNK